MKIRFYCSGISVLFWFATSANTSHNINLKGWKNGTIISCTTVLNMFIQKNEALSIIVNKPNTLVVLNIINGAITITSAGLIVPFIGCMLDNTCCIQYGLCGVMQKNKITTKQLTNRITKSIINKNLWVQPIVNACCFEFKLGNLEQIGYPLLLNMPNKKIPICEALNLVANITFYFKGDDALSICEENDRGKINCRLNLNSLKTFNSP